MYSALFGILSAIRNIKVCRSIILPVDLSGCKSWSVALSECHRVKVFKNRVLRNIFGPNRDDVKGNED